MTTTIHSSMTPVARLVWNLSALACVTVAAYGAVLNNPYLMVGMMLLCSVITQRLGALWQWLPATIYTLVFLAMLGIIGAQMEQLSLLGALSAVLGLALYALHNYEDDQERRWLEHTMTALETGSAQLAEARTPDTIMQAGTDMLRQLEVAPNFAIIAYRNGSPVFLGTGGEFGSLLGQQLSPSKNAYYGLPADHWVKEEALKEIPESQKKFQKVINIYGRGIQTLGILILTRGDRPFTPAEYSVTAAFSRQLGAQLGHLIALQELHEANDLTLLSLGAALEQRDNETSGHTLRVVTLSVRLASELEWSTEHIQALRWGAYLHDIGKIAIPDAILHKTSRLTEEERLEMQSHPQLGYDILQELHFLPPEALEVVRYHHERWDGTGYPAGLSADDIPEAARIFALIDVYDALTHARPYKRAWTQQEALEEIQRQSGKHFDPHYVEVFCRMMSNDADLMVTD